MASAFASQTQRAKRVHERRRLNVVEYGTLFAVYLSVEKKFENQKMLKVHNKKNIRCENMIVEPVDASTTQINSQEKFARDDGDQNKCKELQ